MQKTCAGCGQTKPLCDFAQDRSKASGLKTWCKACDNARRMIRARRAKVVPEVKWCSACKADKPAAAFWADKSKADGLRSACKTCDGAQRRALASAQRAAT